jgi:hypothetical protein
MTLHKHELQKSNEVISTTNSKQTPTKSFNYMPLNCSEQGETRTAEDLIDPCTISSAYLELR